METVLYTLALQTLLSRHVVRLGLKLYFAEVIVANAYPPGKSIRRDRGSSRIVDEGGHKKCKYSY